MEYQSFKFGGHPNNTQAHRQTITPEEFQRRFDFYKKKHEADKKAREEALANNKTQSTPLVEPREQPLGTEPEQLPTNTQEETNTDNNEELVHPHSGEKNEEELLEVDRLYLQRNTDTEDSPRIMSPAFEKLYNSAQGKRPRK